MSKTAYEILGVAPDATREQIDEAYYALRTQYRNDMYQEGALGKAAAKKLTELEEAYREACNQCEEAVTSEPYVADGTASGSTDAAADSAAAPMPHSPVFAKVEQCIRAKDFKAAQTALDEIGNRDAEWHYFQAVIYYNKGWMTEAKNQMEMACNMQPDNAHYRQVLSKLNTAIEGAGKKGYNPDTQDGGNRSGYRRSYAEQDARASEDSCCRWCEAMICMNCLCDCCCRG